MARINRDKMRVAFAVLDAIERILPAKIAKEFWIETYSNCREQGFHIRSLEGAFSFSENRNSDDIVVYFSHNSTDFEMNGNIPGEKAYDDKIFFAYKETKKAAKFIVNKMKEIHRSKVEQTNSRNLETVAN